MKDPYIYFVVFCGLCIIGIITGVQIDVDKRENFTIWCNAKGGQVVRIGQPSDRNYQCASSITLIKNP